MILFHLKRVMKARYLIPFTILLLIPVATSYYSSYMNLQKWIDVYESNSPAVNIEGVAKRIEGYNGLTYVFEFLYHRDSIVVFCLLFATGVMFFIGSTIIEDLTNGNGNLIMSRAQFKKYVRGNLAAQFIFTFVYLVIFSTVLFMASYLFYGKLDLQNGFTMNYNLGIESASLFPYMGMMYLQILNITVVMTLITMIGSLIIVLISNKYIVQLFPLLYFFVVMAVAGTAGNVEWMLRETFAKILTIFVLNHQIFAIVYGYFTPYDGYSITNFSDSLVYVLSLSVIIFILYRYNLKKFGKDYIV